MGVSTLLRLGIALGVLAVSGVPAARGHVQDPQDEILASIGVDERLGAVVPADLSFRDQDGRTVRLSEFLTGQPVVLTLNYFTCSMLCPVTLRGLLSTAGAMRGISLARDFRIVTVSIDPDETLAAARARAGEMHAMARGIPNPGSRWPFLFGREAEVRALTGAVGFRYRKAGTEFAHPDVGIVLTPDGRISRYLYGVEQDPRDLKLALIEAAGGRIGAATAMNRVLLFCFHYDPVGKKYALYAKNIMKAGGVFTLVFLGALYVVLWRKRRAKLHPAGTGDR